MDERRPQPLDAVRAGIEEAAGPFSRGTPPSASGLDGTGRVEATLGRDGRVHALRLDTAWAQDLEPSTLGGAVLEAVQSAGVERARAWGDAAAQDAPAPGLGVSAAGTPAAQPVVEAPPGTPRVPDAASFDRIREALLAGRDSVPTEMLPAMVQALRELNDSVRDVTQQVRASISAGFVGRSPDGHVEATVNGSGNPTAVRYDERWLERAHPSNVAHQTLEALRAAERAAVGHDPSSIVAASPIGRVSSVLDDPEGFVASLGLPIQTAPSGPAGRPGPDAPRSSETQEDAWT